MLKIFGLALAIGSMGVHAAEVVGDNLDGLPSFFKSTQTTSPSSSPFLMSAQECGQTGQSACTVDKTGGKTMCGRAVGEILQCMGKVLGHPEGCNGKCGNGKDFVDCQNGALQKCGYKKITPVTSKECEMPGAVLAYTKTPTARGQLFGHVEFVCGVQKYCSIYSEDHEAPWPRSTPDGCWYPNLDAQSGRSAGL